MGYLEKSPVLASKVQFLQLDRISAGQAFNIDHGDGLGSIAGDKRRVLIVRAAHVSRREVDDGLPGQLLHAGHYD